MHKQSKRQFVKDSYHEHVTGNRDDNAGRDNSVRILGRCPKCGFPVYAGACKNVQRQAFHPTCAPRNVLTLADVLDMQQGIKGRTIRL